MPDYMIPAETTFYEQKIKCSRFLTWIVHTDSPEVAKAFISNIKKQYPDARHVCWAWVAGAPESQYIAMSDDGEPSGTAGKPMLNVLQHKKIGEVTAVVVRYFGGTKLGTGGLSRAYGSSVTEALKVTSLKQRIQMSDLQLSFPYSDENTVRHFLGVIEAKINATDYHDQATFQCSVATSLLESLLQQLPFTVDVKEPESL